MKFSEVIKGEETPEWHGHYICYSKLRKIIERAKEISTNQKLSSEVRARRLEEYEEEFFRNISSELQKVNNFFYLRMVEASRRFYDISKESHSLKYAIHHPKAVNASQAVILNNSDACENSTNERQPVENRITAARVSLSNTKSSKQKFKNVFKTLKLATSEFYLYLGHLRKFQTLNFTGFRKILKKFDKVFNSTRGQNYRHQNIECADFYVNNTITSYQTEIENIYVDIFSMGNRSKGMKGLRIPNINFRETKFETGSFLLGFSVSGCIIMLALCIFASPKTTFDLTSHPAAIVFVAELLILLYIILLSFNFYGWSHSRVNHVLIFEANPRMHCTFIDCVWMGFFLLFIWFLFVFGYLKQPFANFDPYIYPFVSVLVFVIIMVLPFNFFNLSSRKWFGIVALRNLISPAFEVKFADFWLYDQFCSLSFPISILIGYFPCFLIHYLWKKDISVCNSPNMVAMNVVQMVPYYVRTVQCFRRFRDFYHCGAVDMAHIYNAFKYMSSIVVLVLSMTSGLIQSDTIILFAFSIVLRVFSVFYLLAWDIFVDWSLFGTAKKASDFRLKRLLRSKRIYSHQIYYYLALIENVAIRFLSICPILLNRYLISKPPYTSLLISLIVNAFEVFRRFVWNFFRLENEHLNNIGRFRVVRDIPIISLHTNNNRTLPQQDNSQDEHSRDEHLNSDQSSSQADGEEISAENQSTKLGSPPESPPEPSDNKFGEPT